MTIQGQRFPEGTLVLYGFLINLAWEFGQSPLYADHIRGASYVLWTRFHCTVGDVLIFLGCFWLTALWFRTRFWFVSDRPFSTAVFVLFGMGYTIWSEWYNTQVVHSWGLRSDHADVSWHRSRPAGPVANDSVVAGAHFEKESEASIAG